MQRDSGRRLKRSWGEDLDEAVAAEQSGSDGHGGRGEEAWWAWILAPLLSKCGSKASWLSGVSTILFSLNEMSRDFKLGFLCVNTRKCLFFLPKGPCRPDPGRPDVSCPETRSQLRLRNGAASTAWLSDSRAL